MNRLDQKRVSPSHSTHRGAQEEPLVVFEELGFLFQLDDAAFGAPVPEKSDDKEGDDGDGRNGADDGG